MTKEEFKNIRKSLGVTQKEFAEMLGYDKQSISNKECGSRKVTRLDQLLLNQLNHKQLKKRKNGTK